MIRNNIKLRLPWVGKIEDKHYIIRDSFNRVVAVIPPHLEQQKNVGNFILRSTNNKGIKDITLNKIENIVLVAGLIILLLVITTILVDIDYSPMLILGGGLLTTLSYIYLTRTKVKS